MRVNHWLLLLLGVIAVTAFAGGPTPTATPAASPTPTATPALPVLMGTPVPIPAEPITPDNVDRLQQLAVWGRGGAKQMTYSPDGRFLAVGSTAGIWLHDAKTLDLLRFKLTNAPIEAMIFLADGETIMAQAGGNTIIRWNAATGADLGRWDVSEQPLTFMAFAPDGKTLASGMRPNRIGLWDIETGKLVQVMDGHPDSKTPTGFDFSPDGKLLASGATDQVVKVWDVKTGKLWRDLQSQSNPRGILTGYAVKFSPDGKLLASLRDTEILLWEVETGKLLRVLQGHNFNAASLAFSPDGQQLASGAYNTTLRVWNVATGELTQEITGTDGVAGLQFSPDGTTLAVPVWRSGQAQVWDVKSGTLLKELDEYAGQSIISLAVGPDNTLFTGHLDGNIRQWDTTQSRVVCTLAGHSSPVTHLAISADGNTLASSEKEGQSAWIWNLTTGQHIQTLGSYMSMSLRDLALSPDGMVMASTQSSVLYIHDVRTGEELKNLISPNRSGAFNPVFSSDGRLASRSGGEVYLLNAKDGELLQTLQESAGDHGLAFSPDNKTLAVGHYDGTITLWGVAKVGQNPVDIAGHNARVVDIRFSFSGSILAVGFENIDTARPWDAGTMLLWEAKTNKLLYATEIPAIWKMYFTSDDRMLVFQLRDGTVQFWGIPPQ